MHRHVATIVALASLSACTHEPRENPKVVNAASPRCESNERYVMDVCVELGPDDGCTDVGDACIALCDEQASCTTVSGALRATKPRPVAPGGYCVVCEVP